MARYMDSAQARPFFDMDAREVQRRERDRLRRDTTPREYNVARPRTCGGSGEMEIGTSRDGFGNWDTEVYTCPGCPDCNGGAR